MNKGCIIQVNLRFTLAKMWMKNAVKQLQRTTSVIPGCRKEYVLPKSRGVVMAQQVKNK